MKKNKYKSKKKNTIFFSIISLLFIFLTFFSFNPRILIDTEIQYYLTKNKNISSIFQIFDEGNLFYDGDVDY